MADRLSLTNALAAADIDRGKAERIATEIFDATGNVATKADVAELRAEIGELRTASKADVAELRSELKADILELRSELKADILDLRSEFARLETRLTLRLGGAMAVLTGVGLGLARLMPHG